MSAGTTSIVNLNGEAGVLLDAALRVQLSAYNGDGSVSHVRVVIATDSGLTAIVYDSGFRAIDNWMLTENVLDLPSAIIPLQGSTTYYVGAQRRNDADEETALSAAVSFTTETGLTLARWREAAS